MLSKFKERFDGFTQTVLRFPLTMVFLVAWAIMNCVKLFSNDYFVFNEYAYAFLIGACSYVIFQVLYERFFKDSLTIRYAFMGLSILLSAVYFLIGRYSEMEDKFIIRTIIILFILAIAFLWIPTIKREVSFNQTFLESFRAFFTVALFAGLLFLGIILIITTVDNLIVSVGSSYYEHVANVIIILYAPMHFLSLIPVYGEEEEKNPSKFLDSLISYVFIPISAIFTVILLLYIIINIGGDFWADNILEPMLVSYSLSVILIYILASQVDNWFSRFYRKVIAKVLIPIVLFQTIASILKIGELGITLGRYYVIMFGIFATIAGFIFSMVPVKKNGIIAPILIALSIVSILPPVDAFTVSRVNHIGRLEKVLLNNDMLDGDTLRPNGDIYEEDKQIIRNSISYLDSMGYTKDIDWLEEYYSSSNFEANFGFKQYNYGNTINNYKRFERLGNSIEISGHDFIMQSHINSYGESYEIGSFNKAAKEYSLFLSSEENAFILYDEGEKGEIIRFNIEDFFPRFVERDGQDTTLSDSDARFSVENEEAILTILTENVYINMNDDRYQEAFVYILVGIK